MTVPKNASPEHWLAVKIGLNALTQLVDYFGGDYIEIPRCETALRRLKEQEIMQASKNGESNAKLARRFGYTDRGIRKLRRRVEGEMNIDCPQMELDF